MQSSASESEWKSRASGNQVRVRTNGDSKSGNLYSRVKVRENKKRFRGNAEKAVCFDRFTDERF